MASKKTETVKTESTSSTPQEYNVTLIHNAKEAFNPSVRNRAGISVSAGEGYTGPLTDDQKKAIEEDSSLNIKRV